MIKICIYHWSFVFKLDLLLDYILYLFFSFFEYNHLQIILKNVKNEEYEEDNIIMFL